MKLLLLQGANMEALGRRQPGLYGTTTARQLDALLRRQARRLGVSLDIHYTNDEGEAGAAGGGGMGGEGRGGGEGGGAAHGAFDAQLPAALRTGELGIGVPVDRDDALELQRVAGGEIDEQQAGARVAHEVAQGVEETIA